MKIPILCGWKNEEVIGVEMGRMRVLGFEERV